MPDTTTDIQTLATEAASWFETALRDEEDSSTRYTRRKDDAPEWVAELCYTAHGDFFPDDWRYEKIAEALEFLAEGGDPEEPHEFADQAVDVYTGARLHWLASNLNRPGYCDEAAEELGAPTGGIVDLIGLGQYAEAAEIFGLVRQTLEAEEIARS